jgi:polyisoprenoid-binding protein YceI
VDNPKAVFVGEVDTTAFKKLAPGSFKDIDLAGQFTLSGTTKPITAKLRVVKLTAQRLLVETRAPLLINATDFGLEAGVEALRSVMGLNLVSSVVPVSFSVVLK